jgi:chaperonin GroEL
MRKINTSDTKDVRNRVLNGVKQMADLVGMTLGPSGQSVMCERMNGDPVILDDGRRVAENIKLDDPIAQLAVRQAYHVTRKTDEKCGDGTTTAMVLTHSILDSVRKNRTNQSVSEVEQEILTSRDNIISKLKEESKEVKTEKDLVNVATISSGRKDLGEIVGGMFWKLGKDGHISLEFNLTSEILETEVVPGYKFLGGYAEPWMRTDLIRNTSTMGDTHVLVVDRKDLDSAWVEPIIQQIAGQGKTRLLIIARKFPASLLKSLYQLYAEKKVFATVCVKAPSRGEEAFKDIAIYTGARYFCDKDDDITMSNIKLSDLGIIQKAEINEDSCILIEGKGAKEDIARRIEEVKSEEKQQKVSAFKQDRMERVSALSGGVGIIRIGAPTDEERNFLKEKLQDAKYATKYAYRDGVVPGGGTTLKKISDSLPDTDILKEAIRAPHHVLYRNMTGNTILEDITVGKEVIDPVTVEITALTNACSAAILLNRVGGAIAFAPKPKLDEALQCILKTGEIPDDDE